MCLIRLSFIKTRIVMVHGNIIGTGSIRKNEICRLFILPEYQGKGYGSRLARPEDESPLVWSSVKKKYKLNVNFLP